MIWSLVISLWNWSPILAISAHLFIGFFVNGLLIRYDETLNPFLFWYLDDTKLNLNIGYFVFFVFLWPIIVGIYIFFFILAILYQFLIALKKILFWGLRGFRPPPPEPPYP
ncbi:MAG: hypothetical protein UX02_C0002G0107 [Candidatus Moranbacteria bacterium GW2011_GWC1_45_18]|nr:MAG: hypothetical protein UT79_C0001G0354 [Candidatus Moranbacteria bacterium GW2011_GWC2_40_12]KKT33888.1 MAG: hypothetical protein UW19_C0004G0018 [Candidatus Moranbacteria bacterium GW2011_GWF2_44_10]KKT71879.1 MAG: hypothetical protein UW66_C0019G0004 [Candidatus Moranbacteria bacterium GW2011_GWF1_44_4]KKT99788.1 MAG: hypothetical protein UX02_C0002G0107 [Candidatus Moranbacteria bacterium GW2011_GWC1_45_18]OGI34970.1 MAG: hypothetical protein A2407_00380 [Candidatus Moranbacteria bacte